MRILLCNDDGIDADGLAFLERAARALSDDVWVVAPDGKRTAAGASITIGKPLTMVKRAEQRYSCSGTPADCVVSAMTWLFKDQAKPDLVLAGINDGRNVAEDLAYSGTLGIAREATFWGIPAIGFSQVKQPRRGEDDLAALVQLLCNLLAQRTDWQREGHWLSINLPHSLPAPIAQPRIGRDKIASAADVVSTDGDQTVLMVPRGRPHSSSEGDDNDLIDRGFICINRLNWFGETVLNESLIKSLGR